MNSDKLLGPLGYSTLLRLSDEELRVVRDVIDAQWRYRLQTLYPREVRNFISIEGYHRQAHLIDHAKTWPKEARVFSRDIALRFGQMTFFQTLDAIFPWKCISDEEGFGWSNIYWRLVRPGAGDVGSMHCDRWFWELGYGKMPDYAAERIKVWIPIYTEPGKNGLLIIPGSHRAPSKKWHCEERGGLKKPVMDDAPTGAELIDVEPGQAIIFHDSLVHGGAENKADTCRVSIEFTLIVPRS